MTHGCPGPGCTEQVGADMLMCPRHWYRGLCAAPC
jgi:hypothetical protein